MKAKELKPVVDDLITPESICSLYIKPYKFNNYKPVIKNNIKRQDKLYTKGNRTRAYEKLER